MCSCMPFIRTMHLPWLPSDIDLTNSSMAEHPFLMKSAQAVRLRWLRRIWSINSEHCLDMFKRNPKDFLRRFVTVDETWIHHYTPEMKEQSKQWISHGEPAPKKAKTVPSAGKVMATVFWDSHHLHRLFRERKNNHGAILCWFIGPIPSWIDEKTAPFIEKESDLSPWQRTSSLIRNCHSKTGRITLRIAASSTLFSRFGPMRLFFVSKYEKMACRTAIHVERGSHRRNRGLFCGVRQIIFFGWLEKVRISLD